MMQKTDPHWKLVKKLCRLNDREVAMAKALGISPEKALKMRPGPGEAWKDPVALRIRRLHEERFDTEGGIAREGKR